MTDLHRCLCTSACWLYLRNRVLVVMLGPDFEEFSSTSKTLGPENGLKEFERPTLGWAEDISWPRPTTCFSVALFAHVTHLNSLGLPLLLSHETCFFPSSLTSTVKPLPVQLKFLKSCPFPLSESFEFKLNLNGNLLFFIIFLIYNFLPGFSLLI